MEKHFEDLHSYKYLDGSTNRYTDLACSCDESSVEAELQIREEYLYFSVLLIRKPGGRYSLLWPIWGGSARKGYLFQASGI